MMAGMKSFASSLALALSLLCELAAAQSGAPWQSVPRIVIVGPEGDERQAWVREAVLFWNARVGELGSGFALGQVSTSAQAVPEAALQAMSALVLAGTALPGNVPQALRDLPGDLTVVLGDSAFVSFAGPFIAPGKRIVGIRGLEHAPMHLPNVARNVIAHELGHAIGLLHGNDPAMLMCGRPAACRPTEFVSDVARLFPLSDNDRRMLVQHYPPRWAPQVTR